MNEKEVLVRIIDYENDHMIRAGYTSIPAEMLKMYHYLKDNNNISLSIENIEPKNNKYDNAEAHVVDITVVPGDGEWLHSINVYVEVY